MLISGYEFCRFIHNLQLLLLLLLLFPYAVDAFELNILTGYEGRYSSNIERVQDGAIEEFIHAPFVAVELLQNRAVKYNLGLEARLDFLKYHFATNDDEFLFNLGADLLWSFRPDQFEFVIENDFTQTFVDSTLALTPGNRQNVNLFTAGPNASFRLSQLNTLDIEARYANVYAEISDADSHRYSTLTAWQYQFNSRQSASLNLDLLYTDFIDSTTDDFVQSDIFVRALSHSARSEFSLDLGVTYINQIEGENFSNLLARLDWTLELPSNSSLSVNLGTSYTDSGAGALADVSREGRDPADVNETNEDFITNDIFYEKAAEFIFDRDGSFTSWDIRAFYSDRESVHEVNADRSVIGSSVSLGFAQSQSNTWQLEALVSYTSYSNNTVSDYQDTDYELSISWGRRLTRTMAVGLELGSNKRKSTGDLSYDELTAMFSFVYATL